MVTMATRAACPMHAQSSPVEKRLSFLSAVFPCGGQYQAFQVPYCWRSHLEVHSDSSMGRERPVDSLEWKVSVSSKEEPMAGAYLRFSAWYWEIWGLTHARHSLPLIYTLALFFNFYSESGFHYIARGWP